ncbi:unnamed protein product [Allacma fusca]|uniref:Uncharacterized protein n=1 Tax=Allacma fusca TaxID=39272 RepID=A0A8J2LAM4_9HEXA|nr:unnamed protein product [Allacma fusca]
MALTSRFKPFMKIFHLAKGRGKFAIGGSVPNFPLCVEEVIEQLPVDAPKAGIIVVDENAIANSGLHDVVVNNNVDNIQDIPITDPA